MPEEGPRRDFEAAYTAGTPPWDIGRPQPEIVKLAEEGEVKGTVRLEGEVLRVKVPGRAVMSVRLVR